MQDVEDSAAPDAHVQNLRIFYSPTERSAIDAFIRERNPVAAAFVDTMLEDGFDQTPAEIAIKIGVDKTKIAYIRRTAEKLVREYLEYRRKQRKLGTNT